MRQKVINKYLRDQQSEVERITSMTQPQQRELAGPPAEGETMGYETIPPNLLKAGASAQASQFPEARALAKSIYDRNEKMFQEAAKTSSSGSVREGALLGGDPRKLTPSKWGPLTQENVPGVGVFGRMENDRGDVRLQGIQKPAANPVEDFQRDLFKTGVLDLRKLRPEATKLQEVQPKLVEAYRLVKSGILETGALATEITGLKSLAKFLGQEVPPEVPATQYFMNTLVPILAATLKDIRGVGAQSNAELQVAMARAIDANRDPRALEAMLISAMRASQMGLTEYNKQVQSLKELAPRDVNPSWAEREGVAGGFHGLTEDEAKAFFPEISGGTYNPAKGFSDKPGDGKPPPRVNQPREFN
jgi:hypothetical protein